MIVKMKKASLVVLEAEKEASLKQLRKLGALHIGSRPIEDERLKQLADKQQLLARGLALLPDEQAAARRRELESKKRRHTEQSPFLPEQEQLPAGLRNEFAIDTIEASERRLQNQELTQEEIEAYWFELAGRILHLAERKRFLLEEMEHLKREEQRLLPWGEFEPGELKSLQEQGIQFRFCLATREELARAPEGTPYFIITEEKTFLRIVGVGLKKEPVTVGEEIKLPEYGLQEVRTGIKGKNEELAALELVLTQFAAYRHRLQTGLREYEGRLEFEQARVSMGSEASLAYLVGYIPVDKTALLQETARTHGWALLVEDPGPDDPVPTLIRNPKPVRIIRPMFSFLGVTPGYREYDISFWFLLFFSVFFAMIIGDGGYGFIFLATTIAARLVLRKAPAEPFILLFVTSVCTIIWGAITGTWFGSEYLARLWPFSSFVMENIATFPLNGTDTNRNIMWFTFVLGVSHLTLAHIINFFRSLPHIRAIAELGWVSIIWGMYFLAQIMVMQADPDGAVFSFLPGVSYVTTVIWLLGAGAGLVFVFGRQEGNFFKGFLFGLAFAPLTSLNIVSAFADIVSYVRLFAVGLASVEVAKAFNSMAAGVGFEGPTAFVAALILLLGHALNITMGVLSLVVHGVRLNMLEFSGHLGLEWSGTPYRPFKEQD